MGKLERVLLIAALSATVVLGGCAALASAPYDGRESCQGVGGIYTSDGRCLARPNLVAAKSGRSTPRPMVPTAESGT